MGLFDMVGNLVGMGVQAGQNKKQRRWAEAQANKEWTRERQNWSDMNYYNSPEQQMQRFEQAGLNPHLVLGGADAGNAGTMANYERPRGDFGVGAPTGGDGTLQEFQNLKMLKNQNKLIELNQESVSADITKKKILNDILEGVKEERQKYELAKYQYGALGFPLELGQKRLNLAWSQYKDQTYRTSKINIDKDAVWARFLATLMESFQRSKSTIIAPGGWIKDGINSWLINQFK